MTFGPSLFGICCPCVWSITRFVNPGSSGALQVLLVVISVGAWFGSFLTRVLWWGLILRTAWASNSCGKCSPRRDRGHFSQTNNGRMFVCGSPRGALHVCPCHWTAVCVFHCLAQLFSLFLLEIAPSSFTSLNCSSVCSVVYFF